MALSLLSLIDNVPMSFEYIFRQRGTFFFKHKTVGCHCLFTSFLGITALQATLVFNHNSLGKEISAFYNKSVAKRDTDKTMTTFISFSPITKEFLLYQYLQTDVGDGVESHTVLTSVPSSTIFIIPLPTRKAIDKHWS